MLYLLKAKEWQGYDRARAFVVRANSAAEARKLAAKSEDELWLDVRETTCTRLSEHGKAEVVLRDFHNG